MSKFSPAIKALIAFIVIIIVLGAGYFYWNNKIFNKERVGTSLPQSATSTAAITSTISSQGLMLGKNVRIVGARPFDPSLSGARQVSSLDYVTDSTLGDLSTMYLSALSMKGYTLYKKITASTSVQILANNATGTLSVILARAITSTTTRVTIILGEK